MICAQIWNLKVKKGNIHGRPTFDYCVYQTVDFYSVHALIRQLFDMKEKA